MKFLMFIFLTLSATSLSAQIHALKTADTTFVELKQIIPDVVLDVRYAVTNNFTGKVLYPTDKIFLRKIVADSLHSVQKKLKKLGYALKVFDGYRPLSVQKLMWKVLPDPQYVADPAVGSKHNRGSAVDLTLIDCRGKELDMGTEFDDFTEKASPSYTKFPADILENREILSKTMQECGFLPITSEWWHFDFYLWNKFSISDFEIE